MFHENVELLPSGDSYNLSPVINYPIEHTTLVLVDIPIRNQHVWVEIMKE